MRFLLVEDDEVKRHRILRAIEGAYPDAEVVEVRSLRSAEDAVERTQFDMVILDMSIPTFDIGPEEDGGSFQALGGLELLRYIKRYGVSSPVIVVTQFNTFGRGKDALTFQQLDNTLRAEHGAAYAGAIYYETSSRDWEVRLLRVLAGISEGPQ